LNERLFKHGAAILEGNASEMSRLEPGFSQSPGFSQFFRFSFGPLEESSFEGDIEILKAALKN